MDRRGMRAVKPLGLPRITQGVWGMGLCFGEGVLCWGSCYSEQGAMGKPRHGALRWSEGLLSPGVREGFGVRCSPALVCGALLALRAELPQPVRGWRGLCGEVSPS